MNATQAAVDHTFNMLEACATIGARCPINGRLGINKYAVYALAREGKIRIEVYHKNWRVVEILEGPQKGKRTAEPPGGALYRVVDSDGTHWPRRSMQRPLPRAATQRIAP